MPTLRNRERDRTDYRDDRPDDREISLGTGTILAIFFTLALVCAVFFGLGYSMGRKSAQPAMATLSGPVSIGNSNGLKPSATSGNTQSKTAADGRTNAATVNLPLQEDSDASIVTSTKAPGAEYLPVPRHPPAAHPSQASQALSIRQSSAPADLPTPALAMPETNLNGTSIVQVAAVSHQEDADVLISALKKRGYAVFIRQEPQDHLLHIQIGPFGTKKDAEAMRQRLLSDGYNAIVK